MQKTSLIASTIATTVLLSLVTTVTGGIAHAQKAQRPIPLLNAKCVNSGLGTAREQNLDVSIGRAVYTSQFYLGPGSRSASLTCNIKPENRPQPVFQTLNLGFGMRDNSTKNTSVDVRVYLDGQQVESRTVTPGQSTTLALDVSNVSNIAVEAVCSSSSQYCDRVYFFTAGLERPTPPQPVKK
ncbi:hypothetical protein F7734_49560 [Scytonema sp. UIC 10036]|uniref:hypothetical protein n=1 Tax=Scytonema sp. UIC 10036 TaxID=2304196 RepID=UPI0012DAE0F8|nr:hypothetical protein [Scytonema sp. UIC 10036]MUG99900.1 hypothetical protein [Scytonema sp. UIC 10036]